MDLIREIFLQSRKVPLKFCSFVSFQSEDFSSSLWKSKEEGKKLLSFLFSGEEEEKEGVLKVCGNTGMELWGIARSLARLPGVVGFNTPNPIGLPFLWPLEGEKRGRGVTCFCFWTHRICTLQPPGACGPWADVLQQTKIVSLVQLVCKGTLKN